MSDDTYRNMMGLGGPLREVVVHAVPLSGDRDAKYREAIHGLASSQALCDEETILDRTVAAVEGVPSDADQFEIYVAPKADVTVATIGDTIKMQLFSSGGGETLEIPLFDVCYQMSDIPKDLSVEAVTGGFIKAKDEFEGEFLFDVLGKALRSHRNRIQANEVDQASMGSALEAIGRTNHQPRLILSNATWFLRVNGILPPFDPPLEVCCFSPKRRGNQKRIYLLDSAKRLGRQVSQVVKVTSEDAGPDTFSLRCWVRMGCIIFDRDAIACIETT